MTMNHLRHYHDKVLDVAQGRTHKVNHQQTPVVSEAASPRILWTETMSRDCEVYTFKQHRYQYQSEHHKQKHCRDTAMYYDNHTQMILIYEMEIATFSTGVLRCQHVICRLFTILFKISLSACFFLHFLPPTLLSRLSTDWHQICSSWVLSKHGTDDDSRLILSLAQHIAE